MITNYNLSDAGDNNFVIYLENFCLNAEICRFRNSTKAHEYVKGDTLGRGCGKKTENNPKLVEGKNFPLNDSWYLHLRRKGGKPMLFDFCRGSC